MSLFQFLRKNKKDDASAEGAYRSRAEEESSAVRARAKRSSGRNSDPVDPVLPEKKRARRRLIGAVALVLAAVIGLPMVLDTEPKPLADDIAIQIPSMDKPARSSTSQQAASSAIKASVEQGSAARPSSAPAPGTDSAKPSAAPAGDSSRQAVAEAGQPSSQDAIKSGAKPESKPETKLAPKPQKQAEKLDDSERARAILEGKAEPKAADAKAGAEKKSSQFLVQVAALASQEKVNELQGKLKSAGITSHTQKVATETGERIRVRIGPFAGKDEADKMRAKLQKIGLNGTLVPV